MVNLSSSKAYSGFSVDDIDRVRPFYAQTLGLGVSETNGMLDVALGSGAHVLVYPKGQAHVPAEFTVLNFPVADIRATVDELTAAGVFFERYESFDQDERGIARNAGPPIAWFKDPAGNVLSVIEE